MQRYLLIKIYSVFIQHFLFTLDIIKHLYFIEQEDVERKKQKQAERMTNFMNKYKATLENEKLKQSTAVPVSKYEEKYIFAPEDFKYENKHYKYIKYIKNNNQITKVCK